MPSSSPGWRGQLSEHFHSREFACPHCGVAVVRADLVQLLEHLRSVSGRPLHIVSGYRCPVHNKSVGGAANSMHMYGAAADLPAGAIALATARSSGAVGIGHKGLSAIHVDVRDGSRTEWAY